MREQCFQHKNLLAKLPTAVSAAISMLSSMSKEILKSALMWIKDILSSEGTAFSAQKKF